MRRCTSVADRALVDPPTAHAQEQRRAGALDAQAGPAGGQPAVDGPTGRRAVGHGAFLAALAEDAYDPTLVVDVVDVEPDELADPDPGRVEQLEHRDVAQPDGAAVVGEAGGRPDQRLGLVCPQDRRQGLVLLGRAERSARRRSAAGRSGASQAVNTRAAVARRAIVVRLRPVVWSRASQLRSERRSRSVTSVEPSRRGSGRAVR